jgi:prolyl oligopeptidase
LRALTVLLCALACSRRAEHPVATPVLTEPRPARVFVETWPRALPSVPTRREDVRDELFGHTILDPYRWLERGSDAEVVHWVEQQNAATEAFLSRYPGRARIRDRLTKLLAIGSISLPSLRRTANGSVRLFYTRREGQEEQPILYVRDGFDGAEHALLDPTERSSTTTALDWYEPSDDGSLVAYGLSQSGTEDSTLRIRRVTDGSDLPDRIDRTRYAALAWRPHNQGFFYSRYPAPNSVPKGEERLHRRIYEHTLGQDPAHDRLVFGADLAPTDFPGCSTSPEGRWLLINVNRGWSESALYLADARMKPERFERISPEGDARYSGVPREDRLFVLTNEGAERYQIFSVDPKNPARDRWKLLVPEHTEDVIHTFEVVGAHLLVSYLHAGASRLARFSLDGAPEGAVSLPSLGASDGFSGLPDGSDALYTFESFVVPREVRRFDLARGEDSSFLRVESDLRSNDYVIESHSARSRDGTLVPYQLVRQKQRRLGDRRAKTLLYGYGGFNESLKPRFSRAMQVFLENGGVYVQALLRGGGEFGEAWHRAGQLTHKQNTFDDFIAIAEALAKTGVTTPENLAIYGRSNGGLLVAAALTQRAELFHAAVAGVPLTDMLRYPRFLIGKLWVSEYGSPDNEQEFRALLAYSPYHQVRAGAAYPATLVTTAESDTRVDPLHARKFAAALQYATTSGEPVLLRTERAAGHGAGTPLSKQVDELSDVYTFLFAELGLQIPAQSR